MAELSGYAASPFAFIFRYIRLRPVSHAIILAAVSLTIIYRVARPQQTSLRGVLPGAIVATFLWWAVDIGFGLYVRRVPYNLVYGGLAATIGLLIWMQLSSAIIFLGAAWNAESAATRGSRSYG